MLRGVMATGMDCLLPQVLLEWCRLLPHVVVSARTTLKLGINETLSVALLLSLSEKMCTLQQTDTSLPKVLLSCLVMHHVALIESHFSHNTLHVVLYSRAIMYNTAVSCLL